MTFGRQALFATSAIICGAAAAPAMAQAKNFDIPAQTANSGIAQLGRQADVQIGVARKFTRGKRTNAVRGQMSIEQALTQLLQGTGLVARATGAQTYTIIPLAVGGPSSYAVAGESAQAAVEAAALDPAETESNEDIVVTAQKREERLRDVPISISAVTGDTMQRQGATRFSDIAGYVSGLAYQPGTSGAPSEGRFILRGVSSATTPIATTAIYVDDVPTTTHGSFAGSNLKALDLFPYDVERVEILRGPQGTLYGDSTIAGLVKYVTRTADVDDFFGSAGVEGTAVDGGDGIGVGVRGAVNVPIAPGVFGMRVSGFYQETPGYQTNLATGEEGTNWVEQRGWRVAARFTPTDALKIDAQWLHSEHESGDRALTRLVPRTTIPFYGDYLNFSNVAQPTAQKFDLVSLTAKYDFGPVNLTSVSGYSNVVRSFDADYTFYVRGIVNALTGGAVTDAIGLFRNPNATKKYTQELRLASSDDQRLSWLVGAYYTREDTHALSLTIPYYADGAPISSLTPFYDTEIEARYTDLSIFANATFKITGKWDVSAGIRQSWITDEFESRDYGVLVGGDLFDASETKNHPLTWSIGTRYVANDDLMMFARVATAFRAGSTNFTGPGVPRGFDPDSLTAYEAGIRADLLDNLATIDLTVYYLDWKDLFITAFTADDFPYTTNGGRANGPGMEFTGTLRPVRNLTFTATAAYFGLKLREDLPTAGAQAGDRPPASPAWTGSLLADYGVPLGGEWQLRLGGGVRWSSHSYSRFASAPGSLRIDDYIVGDLNATISKDRWTLRAYIRNVTNENKVMSISQDSRGVQMVPRTFGLGLDVSF